MNEETVVRYGHYDAARRHGYPLADWLFGHRLYDGQHWIEYLLEFLNVVVGFDYQLGQGIDGRPGKKGYKRFARYGLRRFIFYDGREKTTDPRDDRALTLLNARLDELIDDGYSDNDGTPLESARELLRSYSAVEQSRSWFAKSLFPAHEQLLFWEALRKGATKWRYKKIPSNMLADELDRGMELSARNFFARGGEIYYLIISAGTENHPDRRDFIEQRIGELLRDENRALGKLAETIDRSWTELCENEGEPTDAKSASPNSSKLGWLPDPGCSFYEIMAEDLESLLRSKLDPLETLDLLAHLICFHLLIYIYHRAHQEQTSELCAAGTCVGSSRPLLLIDCLEGKSRHIRRISSSLYKEWQQRQKLKAQAYVKKQVQTWAKEMMSDQYYAKNLATIAEKHFNVSSLHKKSVQAYREKAERLQQEQVEGRITEDAFAQKFGDLLSLLLFARFRKFLGVHRKLARSIGFIQPFQGPMQRFVFSDSLLKALVLASIPPQERLHYDRLLSRLYLRYGLVVGQTEVRESGLFDRHPINAEYYDQNWTALHDKLKYAGLLEEYSDATALVVNDSENTNTDEIIVEDRSL